MTREKEGGGGGGGGGGDRKVASSDTTTRTALPYFFSILAVRLVATVTPAVQVVEEGAVASISCNVMGTALVVTWRSPDHMDITSSVAHGKVASKFLVLP